MQSGSAMSKRDVHERDIREVEEDIHEVEGVTHTLVPAVKRFRRSLVNLFLNRYD